MLIAENAGLLSVPVISILGIVFTFILSSVFPVAAGSIINKFNIDTVDTVNTFDKKNKKIRMKALYIIIGCAVFLSARYFTQIPLIQFISATAEYESFAEKYKIISFAITAFSAVLFEFFGKYITLKIISKKNSFYNKAIGIGFGYGAAESVLLFGVPCFLNLFMSVLINFGILPDNLKIYSLPLISRLPILYYADGVEALCALFINITLTAVLAYFIYKNKAVSGFLIFLAVRIVFNFIIPLLIEFGLEAVYAIFIWILMIAVCFVIALNFEEIFGKSGGRLSSGFNK